MNLLHCRLKSKTMEIAAPDLFYYNKENETIGILCEDKESAEATYNFIYKNTDVNIVMTADDDFLIQLHIYTSETDKITSSLKYSRTVISGRIDFWDLPTNKHLNVIVSYIDNDGNHAIGQPLYCRHHAGMNLNEFTYQTV